MKIITLKISISIIMLLFYSCLNSKDSSIESGRDFCYITSLNNTICAATSSGYITSPEIKNLEEKECYIIAYKITNPVMNGLNIADKVVNISEEPIPQNTLHENSTLINLENSVAVKELSVPVFKSTDYLGDRWLFNYSMSAKEKEKITAHFIYDKNNQIDASGNKIEGENKLIIDVYFTKTDVKDNDTAKEKNRLAVGNLESLRILFTPNYEKATIAQDGTESVPVLLQFRYQKYVSENNPPKELFLGTWDINTNNRVFYMTFVQKKL